MPGFNQASNLTSNLPQTQAKYYDKNFFENLKYETPYLRCATMRELPLQSGNTYVFFEYPVFGPNTNQGSEGAVGSGLTITPLTNQTQIGEYNDYASFSTLATFTGIDPMIKNVSKEMAYRLGQSLSIIGRNQAEAVVNVDSSANYGNVSTTATMKITDVRSMIQSLRLRGVKGYEKGKFCGVISSNVVGDITNDSNTNGLVDVWKHTPAGLGKLERLAGADQSEVIELELTGAYFHQTTLVTQTANFQSGGKVAYRSYLFGEDGYVVVTMQGPGDTAFGEGDYRTIKPLVRQNVDVSVADQAGVIGGWTSYRAHIATTLVPDTTARLRYADFVSAIS